MSSSLTAWRCIAIGALTAVAVGCSSFDHPERSEVDPAPSAPQGERGGLLERVNTLRIEPETSSSSYDRDAFGADWTTGPDGCSTREHVLLDESLTPATTGPDCTVVSGDWISAYDNYRTPHPDELDIDHLVALAEAWESGAADWTEDQRIAFANDLAHPAALIAVTASTNRSKGDQDPAKWMPPNADHWCGYAIAWIDQKLAWNLTADPAEHQALTTILASCHEKGVEQ